MKLRTSSMTVIIAALCLVTTACNTNHIERSQELPDSAYVYTIDAENNEALMQVTYYTYDTRGNLILQYDSIVAFQSHSASKKKTEMQYNAKGKLIERKESSYSPLRETWENGECQVFEYNEDSKLASEFIYEHFTEPLSNPDKKLFYTWTDDAHATCLAYIHEQLSERTECTYDANGQIEKTVSYSLNGNTEGVLWCSATYEYDQHGNLTEFAFYDSKGDQKMSDSHKYEYGSDGRILVEWSNFFDGYLESQKNTKAAYYY